IVSGLIIIILARGLSSVRSFDKSPVASLGENQLLSCYLNMDQTTSLSRMSVTWTKSGVTGVVSEFKNGGTHFEDQNTQFKGRAALFPAALLTGNASLLLSAVRSEDQGQYTCTISSSSGGGTVSVELRTGAFSAPSFTLSKDSLTAVAEQWFPEPSVTWTDQSGIVLNGNTSLKSNSAGVYSKCSACFNMINNYNALFFITLFWTLTLHSSWPELPWGRLSVSRLPLCAIDSSSHHQPLMGKVGEVSSNLLLMY
uniref:V-set domain containing T cell activation inhibitor 1 n=1 Tax=Neogobius melanostomus TaxID=47308 RepID=A0A8C6TIS7_9GOBI